MRPHESGPDITFIVTYECAHCHALLEARTAGSAGWLRCPSCGRAGRPPDTTEVPRRERPPLDDDVLVIGPGPEHRPTTWLLGQAPAPPWRRRHPGGGRRLGLGVGLAVSTALFLVSGLELISGPERNLFNVAFFGLLTLMFVAYLSRPLKRD